MILRYGGGLAFVAACLAGCGRPDGRPEPADQPTRSTPASEERPVVLFVGTSLTAGLGVDPSQAYPALIQAKIDSAALSYRVVNAGVSGETSAGARSRVDWLFRQRPAVLVLETGANDGLRGIPPASVRANIAAILDRARALSPAPRVVLVGMQAPPNLGARYTRAFGELYPQLAREYRTALVPFLLEAVAGVDSLNQPDGIHPTPRGQRIMAETVWRVLEPELRNGRVARGAGD